MPRMKRPKNTLRDNWQDIVTDRRYVAIVSGEKEKDGGTVESWLTDHKLYVSSSPYDDGEGKYAVTHYRTINARMVILWWSWIWKQDVKIKFAFICQNLDIR